MRPQVLELKQVLEEARAKISTLKWVAFNYVQAQQETQPRQSDRKTRGHTEAGRRE
jgi:hypothetical protein